MSSFNFVDVRGSYSTANYKRVEAEFVAPRLFHRRGELSVLGGWRDAPQINFTGLGNDTSTDNKTSFSLTLPYVSTTAHGQADTAIPDAARRRRVVEVDTGTR